MKTLINVLNRRIREGMQLCALAFSPFGGIKGGWGLLLCAWHLSPFGGTEGGCQTWMTNSGAKIYVAPNAAVNVQGNMLHDTASVLHNYGTVRTDVTKTFGTIQLNGDKAKWEIDDSLILQQGKFFLNGNSLVLYNADTLALKAVDGKLVANNANWGKVRWFIKENTGNYLLPFSNDSLEDISIQFEVVDAGTGEEGFLEFSTFGTLATDSPNNDLHPPDMIYFQEAAATIDSNWQKIADRYWLTKASGFSSKPLANIGLRYLQRDIAGLNIINSNNLMLSRLKDRCWEEVGGEADTIDKLFTTDTLDDYYIWMLHDTIEQVECNSGLTCEEAIWIDDVPNFYPYLMEDSIMWFRYIASDSIVYFQIVRFQDSLPFEVLKISLFDDSCSEISDAIFEAEKVESNPIISIVASGLQIGNTYQLMVEQAIGDESYFYTIARPSHHETFCYNFESELKSSEGRESGLTSDCSRSSVAYRDKYRYQDTYMPDPQTFPPTITLKVNVHVIQKEDPNNPGQVHSTDPGNFVSSNQMHVEYIQNLFDESFNGSINGIFKNFDAPTDEPECVCGTCYTADSKIRFELANIYYHPDNIAYGNLSSGTSGTNYHFTTYATNTETELNIFFIGPGLLGGRINTDGWPAFNFGTNSTDCFIRMVGVFEKANNRFPDISPEGLTSLNIAHELAHCLGLHHLYNDETCTRTSLDYLEDCFGNGQCSRPCPSTYGWTCAGNNIANGDANNDGCARQLMDLGGDCRYLSPQQIGRMHRELSIRSPRKYVKDCPYSDTPWEISQDEVWNFNIRLYRSIKVNTGATLTIKCTVLMPNDANIVVQRGARLIVDGGTITNACNDLWMGIIVEGNAGKDQPAGININTASNYTLASDDHGVVVLLNHGTVENAEVGIQLGSPSTLFNLSKSGGMIFSDDGIFRNNKVAVRLAWSVVKNKSEIINSRFETTADLATLNAVPEAFVQTYAFNGNPYFSNNTFINTNTNSYWYERGIGIEAYGPFVATGRSAGFFDFDNSTDQNVFENLYYGIKTNGGISFGRPLISRNRFINTVRAILLSGEVTANVTYNEIEVGMPFEEGGFVLEPAPYAIYLEGCDGYKVEKNIIEALDENQNGIYVAKTGTNANEIYNNELHDISANLLGDGENSGTQFKCNKMFDANYHIAVVDGTIRPNQGNNCFDNPSNQAPAGNRFSSCNTSLSGGPHLHRNPGASGFTYWHHNLNDYRPTCNSTAMIPIQCQSTTIDCPSRIFTAPPANPGDIFNIHDVTCLICFNDWTNEYRGGLNDNWENLFSMVKGYSMSASAMRESLVSQGNSLPDDILLEAVIKKTTKGGTTPFFSDAQLRDILVTNAPNTYRVMKSVREKLPAFNGDVLEEIEAAQDSPATGRLDTMHLIHELEHKRTLIYNDWIGYALEDSSELAISELIDSLNLEIEPNLRVKLAELYIMEDSLEEARAVLDSIPLYDGELREYYKFASTQLDLADSGKTWLDADSSQVEGLWDITVTETRASIKAKNVLRLLADTSFTEEVKEIVDTSGGGGKRSIEIEKIDSSKNNLLEPPVKLYPNPATDELIVEYNLDVIGTYFSILSIIGQEQLHFLLEENSGKRIIKISQLSEGLYLYKISSAKGSLIQKGKFVIMQ